MATGVLVLLFGEATKLSSIVTGHDKLYVADVDLGRGTDSHDALGAITSTCSDVEAALAAARLPAALETERARALQVPPSVSAVKVGGERAYRLARRGEPPSLAPRPIRVRSLELLGVTDRRARLQLCVSAGYYVRALARDLGETLGVPAHLSSLRRLASGTFSLDAAAPWPPPPDTLPVPLTKALPGLLPTVRLNPDGVLRARQGKPVRREDLLDDPEDVLRRWQAGRRRTAGDASEPPRVWGWTNAEGHPVAIGVDNASENASDNAWNDASDSPGDAVSDAVGINAARPTPSDTARHVPEGATRGTDIVLRPRVYRVLRGLNCDPPEQFSTISKP
jgi:tRNA pseudouridine55 synthase